MVNWESGGDLVGISINAADSGAVCMPRVLILGACMQWHHRSLELV